MNQIQKIFAVICIAAVPFFGSCGKDDPVGCSYLTEVQNEADALTTALTTYSNDPSIANCNAYKDAYQDYLDALDEHNGCVLVGEQAAYQDAIDQAQAALDALQC